MKAKFFPSKLIISLIMILLAASIIFPFFWMFLSTFKFEKDIISYPPTIFSSAYTFKQFVAVWDRMPIVRFSVNTLVFAGLATGISIILDSMSGYAFARLKFKGKNGLFTVVLVSLMIPFQVIMIPLFIIVFKLGILDTYAGLILPKATGAFGIFLMRSFFISLPKDLEESGRIDGFSEFGIFWRLMLPLCVPATITLGIFYFMNHWNDLLYPLMLTNQTKMRTLSAGLALFVGDRKTDYGPTLAAAAISVLPPIIAFVFAQKYFVRSIAMSGLKG